MKKIYLYQLIFLCLSMIWVSCRGASEGERESHESHHHDEGELNEVELTEAQIKAVGIELGEIEMRAMSELVSATGELSVNASDEAVVAPVLGGVITKIFINEGDRVNKGQTIAYIESPDLMKLQQEYLLAVAEESKAQQEMERQQKLSENGAGIKKNLLLAESEFKIAKVNKESLAGQLGKYGINPASLTDRPITSFPVVAEISGSVTKVMSSIGNYADMTNPIARIADTSSLFCTLRIFENYLKYIKSGQSVDMRLTNNPDVEFQGVVKDINPVMNPDTKTVPVIVKINNLSTSQLIPGMTVTASIATGEELVTALPEESVVSAGGRSFIFVLEDVHEEEGQKAYHFEKREVVCGANSQGYVQISPLEPLPENARIVTANAFYLNSMTSEHGEHSH